MRLYINPTSKKVKNRVLFLLLVSVLLVELTKAQDVHFSQFFEAPLLRNPSLAGIYQGDVRVQGVYRDQWGAVSTPYKTGSFNFEIKKHVGNNDDYITYGMQMLYDKAGTASLTTTHVMPAFNYHKSLSGEKSKYLSMGFMGGMVQRVFDRSKITTNSMYDGNGYNPALPDGETLTKSAYNYLDGSVGVCFNSSIANREGDNYFVGIAYHHLNRPRNSFYKNPEVELSPKIVVSTGVKFSINETSYFTFHADYSKQGNYTETVGGVMYSYKMGEDLQYPMYTLHLGAFLRAKDSFIPVIKLDYAPYSFALSYDANVSQLKTASQGRGGLEFSISYTGFFDKDGTSKYIPLCPKF